MKRRNFIQSAGALSVPLIFGGLQITAYGKQSKFTSLLSQAQNTDRVLVLIQLGGGNDGLNTVIPLDNYNLYNNARSNIAIAENQVLKLTNSTGINPAMTHLQSMYNEQKVRLVQSVGYPNPNFSHFRSTDIWLTGADYDSYVTTGWLGRELHEEFPLYPSGFPNSTMPHPPAIQVGSTISIAFDGPTSNMGMAWGDAGSYYNTSKDNFVPTNNPRAGKELDYVRRVSDQVEKFVTPVRDIVTKTTTKSKLFPADKLNPLADQLKVVAKMITGGMKTRVYHVSMTGFDTHSGQNSGTLSHPILLGQLSQAIQAFQDEIKIAKMEDKVIGMTFSEFGRRIKSNSSAGTDHGAAAPLFVFGTNVVPGVLGKSPIIPSKPTEDDNVEMQYDFRSIYASLLKDWFCVDNDVMKKVLFDQYPILPIIKGGSTDAKDSNSSSEIQLSQNFPNPFSSKTIIRLNCNNSFVSLKVYDLKGVEVDTLIDKSLPQGSHEIVYDGSNLPQGKYFIVLINNNVKSTKEMVKI
ncbi:MAG: DUF1501 domain-containing protein [Chlorobiota bacterium]|nr:DUF1501 domain-containing protein [Chlorobiota bacterium]QQS65933.1 MAG: DUF1501 domain-containing protein [Chlorobiota bacterium]